MNFRFLACFLMVMFTSGTALLVANADGICYHPQRRAEEPLQVSPCQLSENRLLYNQRQVQVTGFMTRGFEDSSLFDVGCQSWPSIWVEYGGTAKSPEVFERVPIRLTRDARFQEFDNLLKRPPHTVVRATVVGRFFAGKREDTPRGIRWSGYGHMGCCSLFVIERVVAVEPQTSTELDYSFFVDQPNITAAGCGYTFLTDTLSFDPYVKAQRKADEGQTEWMFTDPERVAADHLAQLLSVDSSSIKLKQTRQAQGRYVYEWRPGNKKTSYMIVVSRPYWLSFSAKDPNRVAWMVLGAYESSCGGRNSVTLIR